MRLLPLVLAALVAVGCSGTADADETSPAGRTFISVEVQGEPIPGDEPLTLEFVDGRVSAYAGCNRSSGSADLAGGRLTVSELASTMMGCPPPFGDADGWLARFLDAGPAWTLSADTLTLSTPESTVTLRDKAAVDPDRPLVGTSWQVESLVSADAVMTSALLEQSKPGLTIRPDQTVTGWTGCNTFYGRADVAGPTVTFFPVSTGGPACDGELGDIERSIIGVLDGPVQATVDADRLTLTGAKGHGLVLRAA